MPTAPVIRAIDVGFGNTKYTQSTTSTTRYAMFPSDAPPVQNTGLSDSMGPRRDTKRIKVNNKTYELGPDVRFAQSGGGYGRQMSPNFSAGEDYRVLTYGAMEYMNVDFIDVLVLGLPVSTWNAKRVELAKAYSGMHTYHAIRNGTAYDRLVTVREVKVIPQPYGGFVDAMQSADRDLSAESTLVIDPGYFTLDWLFLEGQHISDNRSNALENMGIGAYVGAIQRAMEADIGVQIRTDKLEMALHQDKLTMKAGGKEVPLAKYLPLGESTITQAVNRLIERIGSVSDIDNIVIVGGAAALYEMAVRKQVPKTVPILISQEPIFSNVRGYQIMGEKWATDRQ